jgi:branched-chain amino acid transport system ATP-binding protein
MLKINNINVSYGDVQVINDVSLTIKKGEFVAVIGSNGAGKTTLLKTVSGLLQPNSGSIEFMGKDIHMMPPEQIVAEGIIHVPEGRLLFPDMTVRENLEMGAYRMSSGDKISSSFQSVYDLFPVLEERKTQLAGTLSGGEQQMLAIGRGLMADPALLMLDEPSLGLAPMLVVSIFEMVEHINRNFGITVLLIEQNVRKSCEMSDRAYVLENGHVVLEGMGEDMLKSEHVKEAYLGL